MRINARLDKEGEAFLAKVQRVKGFTSITDALNYSLKEAANNLSYDNKTGDKMRGFLASDYVGAFSDSVDGSSNYKEYLYQGLEDKHDIV